MPIFHKVFQQTESGNAAGGISPREGNAQVKPGQNEFVSSFKSMTINVAKPLFDQLAHVAKARGYPSAVKEGVDEKENPFYAVTFIPEVGATLGAPTPNECIFQLKALLSEQTIECTSCHDQRAGKKGIRVMKSDLQSINQVFLEAEIEEFVTSSLEAREPT